jgi:hypothetical protein
MAKQPRLARIKITELSKDGLGKGICDPQEGCHQVVEVPFCMPGDEVEVHLTKGFIRATLWNGSIFRRIGSFHAANTLGLAAAAAGNILPMRIN